MITLVVVTDGRQPPTIERTLESARENLVGAVGCTIIDDSANPEYQQYLDERFSDYRIVHHPERRGLGGALRSAWTEALMTPAKYVFHLEDDFVFNGPLHLDKLVGILDSEPMLAQLVLKRNPDSAEEISAGGQIEVAPDEHFSRGTALGEWVEHTRLFSFNPCLIRRDAMQDAVDSCDQMLERDVTDVLLAHGYRFAYYGNRADAPRVQHIGNTRSPGYRW